ncbi:FAD-binding oxidoreductase [Gluconobacter japonicus]|uniref:NAD(P)/FAD-dependent oxidoreductase n=1 Tax=Gluconobacter japonicus TaxID=376620 RepID=UPI0024AD1E2B|nr:FAD-binding oxidoreductase [Gluconobacter japonicus]MDI6653181.1 FAD-binding oxidoreductase [Gluconobacter japonicus]
MSETVTSTRLASRSVLVLGGGIVARCCAMRLQEQGYAVTLVAEPDATPPSWGNAGHIATEQVQVLARLSTASRVVTDLFPRGPVALDWRNIQAWLPWSFRFLHACCPATVRQGDSALKSLLADALPAWKRLTETLGQPDLLDLQGIIKLWEGATAERNAIASLQADSGAAIATRVESGLIDTFNRTLSSPVKAAVHFAGTAHITSPRDVLDRLLARFTLCGGVHLPAMALNIDHTAKDVRVTTTAGDLVADRVIVACGVRSGGPLPQVTVPLIAERGYHVEWDHGGGWMLPNVVFEDRAVVVTRFGSRLRATSFVEFTRDASSPDPRKWDRLEAHVRELGLPVASDFSRWHGSRPTLPDYLPALGTLRNTPRVVAAYGHNHLGLTLAPITAELITAHLLHGMPLPTAFNPDRFSLSPLFSRNNKDSS